MITNAKVIERIFKNHATMSRFVRKVREDSYIYCSHCGDRKDHFTVTDDITVECDDCNSIITIEQMLNNDKDSRNKDLIVDYLKCRVFDDNDRDFRRAFDRAKEELREEKRQREEQEQRESERAKRNSRKVLTEQAKHDIINTSSKTNQKNNNEEGDVTMTNTNNNTNGANTLFGGFNMTNMMGEMGAINDGRFKFSMMGIAIKDANGGYSCYNKETGALTDCMGMTFDMPDMFFAMPTGAIKEGDLILNNSKPLYVINKVDDNKVVCINPVDGLEQTVLLKKSPFGFNFHTKIFSMMEMFGGEGMKNGEFNPMMFALPMMMGGMGQQGQEGQQNPMQSMMQMFPMMMMFGGNKGDNPFSQMFNMGQSQEKKEVIEIDENRAKDGRTLEYKILELKEKIAKREEEKEQKAELKKLEEQYAEMEKEEE